MKNEILEYLKETEVKLIEKFLQENCTQIEQREPYGDTDAVVGRFYSDDDYEDAINYAQERIDEVVKLFIKNGTKELREVEVKDFDDVVEKAKSVIGKI